MAGTGQITDEGLAQLRATIGIAVPHTQPPHYFRPNEDTFRHVAESYGDANPLWSDPEYATKSVWGDSIAPPSLVGGDTLIGEDEVTTLSDEDRALTKGDPLRGVHAFYASSAREWWAPLRANHRVFRRNALVAALDKRSDFAGRAIHEWSAQVFRDDEGTILGGQYRNMIRTERNKARGRKKYDEVELKTWTEDEIAEIDERYAREVPRGAEPRWWEDVNEGDEVGPLTKGPLDGHRHGVLARRHGYRHVRGAAAAVGLAQPATHPAFLHPQRTWRTRRPATRALGARRRPKRGEPHHVRLRPHARDVADPLVHRLDGRRRVAVEARLRIPAVQLCRRPAHHHRDRGAQIPRGR